MKSFSLQISRDEGLIKNAADESSGGFGSLNFTSFEETWQHCSDWLRRNSLGAHSQLEAAFATLMDRAQSEELTPGPHTFSMLHELKENGAFNEIPREPACALFGHQRWDFIPIDYRFPLPSKDNEEIFSLLQYLGVIIIGFSKRIITLAHSDPWIAHLASRRLAIMQVDKASSRTVGVVNLPTSIHRAIYETQMSEAIIIPE